MHTPWIIRSSVSKNNHVYSNLKLGAHPNFHTPFKSERLPRCITSHRENSLLRHIIRKIGGKLPPSRRNNFLKLGHRRNRKSSRALTTISMKIESYAGCSLPLTRWTLYLCRRECAIEERVERWEERARQCGARMSFLEHQPKRSTESPVNMRATTTTTTTTFLLIVALTPGECVTVSRLCGARNALTRASSRRESVWSRESSSFDEFPVRGGRGLRSLGFPGFLCAFDPVPGRGNASRQVSSEVFFSSFFFTSRGKNFNWRWPRCGIEFLVFRVCILLGMYFELRAEKEQSDAKYKIMRMRVLFNLLNIDFRFIRKFIVYFMRWILFHGYHWYVLLSDGFWNDWQFTLFDIHVNEVVI